MKLIALVAALGMAGAAAAQDMPATQDAPAPAPAAQPAPMAEPMPADQPQTATTGAGMASTTDPKGGYQPSTPLFSTPPQPGQTPVFQANPMTPSQAYPAPAPLAKYPLCKKGQYDDCRQRGGR